MTLLIPQTQLGEITNISHVTVHTVMPAQRQYDADKHTAILLTRAVPNRGFTPFSRIHIQTRISAMEVSIPN